MQTTKKDCNKYEQRYPGNEIITKSSLPQVLKEEEMSNKYSRLSLSRPRLSRIIAYLEVKNLVPE